MLLQGIAAPLLMAAIIGFAFGGGFSFSARIGLADADRSEVTTSMVEGMTSGDQSDDSPITFVAIEPDDADAAVERGEVDAVLVFPSGFGAAVTSAGSDADAHPIEVVYDPEQQITADVAGSIAQRVAAQLHASQIAVAATLAAGPQPPSSRDIDETVAAVASLSIPLTVDQEAAGAPYSPVAYFGPAMAMVFLFFTIGAGARSVMAERKEGTLQRVRAAPITDASILLGKTASVVLLGLMSLLVIWLVTTVAFGADWGEPAAVLAVIVGVVCSISGISIFVTGLARTDAQADGLTAMVAFVLALVGGNFIQPGAMPEALEAVSVYTPNGLALRAFTQIGAADAGLGDVLGAVLALVVGGVAIGALGIVLLRRKVVS